MGPRQQYHYLEALRTLNNESQLIIRPQSQDHLRVKERNLDAYMAERAESRVGFYRLEPEKNALPAKIPDASLWAYNPSMRHSWLAQCVH
ncbi:hypothetical protein BZK31_22835 [Pseudomonas floridensis]|uniref:Uncharacterized protein n=1 Tax=Pseudomonas floridensis TaxID=1958950 RepID=A0A1X0N0R6_9PSED|nr:hypothetical protein BZK31_22835 [Pseudomonas floridensis]